MVSTQPSGQVFNTQLMHFKHSTNMSMSNKKKSEKRETWKHCVAVSSRAIVVARQPQQGPQSRQIHLHVHNQDKFTYLFETFALLAATRSIHRIARRNGTVQQPQHAVLPSINNATTCRQNERFECLPTKLPRKQ